MQEGVEGKDEVPVEVMPGKVELSEWDDKWGEVDPNVAKLAGMNDLYYSRIFAKELYQQVKEGKISEDQYLKFCAQVTGKRYYDAMVKQKVAVENKGNKEAGFNQVVRNSDFLPRSLMETYLSAKLSKKPEVPPEAKSPIEVLTDLVEKVVRNPTDDKAKQAVVDEIINSFPPELLDAVIPFYNMYLGNENEDNVKVQTDTDKSRTPEQVMQRRKEDFCGQLIFMVESNVMARGATTKEKTDLAKAFNVIRKVGFSGLVDKLDERRKGREQERTPPTLEGGPEGIIAKVEAGTNEVQIKAGLAETKVEAEKVLDTLRGLRQQNIEKGQEFKLQNIVDMQAKTVIVQVCEEIEKKIEKEISDKKAGKTPETNYLAMTEKEFQSSLNQAIDERLTSQLKNYMLKAVIEQDTVAIDKGLKAFKQQPASLDNIIGEVGPDNNKSVKNIKTRDYKRSGFQKFKDFFSNMGKSIVEGKWRNPLKAPERTLQEVVALGHTGNEPLKQILDKVDEVQRSERKIEMDSGTQMKIDELRPLGETKHYGEPTFAQKWIAVLYNKLDTDKSLNETQKKALIGVIEVLAKHQDNVPGDGLWSYMIKPEIHDALNSLTDNKIEGDVPDMIRELSFGNEPASKDMVTKLTQLTKVLDDEKMDDQMPEVGVTAPTYRGSQVISQKVTDIAEKWVQELTTYMRDNARDLSEADKNVIQDVKTILIGIEKYENSTQFNERLKQVIADNKREHGDAIHSEVLQKLDSVRTGMREGKEPPKDMFAQWAQKLEEYKKSNGGLKVDEEKLIDKVIAMLENPSLKANPGDFGLILHEQINKYKDMDESKLRDEVVRLVLNVNQGVKDGKGPEKKEDTKRMSM